jgi:hypothetical protein
MFPSGVTFADGRFGTRNACPFLGLNVENGPHLEGMASPTGTALLGLTAKPVELHGMLPLAA